MNRNVNVFIGVILCALLCGCFVWLFSVSEEDTWKPNEIYDQLHATSYSASYTNVNYSVSSNSGLALTMSPSSALRRRAVSSYAGAYSGVATMPLTSNLSPLTYGAAPGAGLYTTSSAEIKSFGGGGNGGAAMSYSQSPIANRQSNSGSFNPSLQGGAGVGSISPIAYSTARRSDMTATGENLAQMAAENPVMAMTNAASAGMGNGMFGGYTAMDYSGSANYGQYTGMFGGGSRMGVRGRFNAPGNNGATGYDSWLLWLKSLGYNFGDNTDGNNYTFTTDQSYAAFCAWYKAQTGKDYDPNNPLVVPEFTYEDWLAWIASGTDGMHNFQGWTFQFLTPVGDILPLLLLALLYVLFLVVKSKSFTSLLKTERSE